MYAGTLGTFHTAAFVKELSLWVKGNKAKRLDLGIIITHLTTTEAPGVINSGLPAGSSKDSSAMLIFHSRFAMRARRAIYLHSSDEEMGETGLFKGLPVGKP